MKMALKKLLIWTQLNRKLFKDETKWNQRKNKQYK